MKLNLCSVEGCKDEAVFYPYKFCKSHAKFFLLKLNDYAKTLNEKTYKKAEENFYLTDESYSIDDIERLGIIINFYLLLADEDTKDKLKEFAFDLQKKMYKGDFDAIGEVS
jgi:hypothetical protein